MRILCLAFLLAEYPQLLHKIDAQAQGLARFHECHAYVLGPQPLPENTAYGFSYRQLPWSMPLYYAVADTIIEKLRPDIIYFRYLAADEHLYAFVARHENIILEHNTIEEAEYKGTQRLNECRYGAKIVAQAAGLCCVTQEILVYERTRAKRDMPGMVIGNGVMPEHIRPLAFALPEDGVHMVCAAHFAPWHGMDRLIRGMAAYKGSTRFVLHLAGRGGEIEAYQQLAQDLGIHEQVCVHGFCDRAVLDALTSRCHIAVGALGIHRKNLSESAAIKLREYCLQGRPFFLSGQDPDFSPLPEFARVVPNDESPIDMTVVEDLACAASQKPAMRQEMRCYGEERLSWVHKTQNMAVFFEQCCRNIPAWKRDRKIRTRAMPSIADSLPEYAALWITRCAPHVFLLDVLDAHVALLKMSEETYGWIHGMVAQYPEDAAAQLWLGFAHESKQEFADALLAYMRTMSLDGKDWQAALRVVFVHKARGDIQKADIFTKICLEREPALAVVFQMQGLQGTVNL